MKGMAKLLLSCVMVITLCSVAYAGWYGGVDPDAFTPEPNQTYTAGYWSGVYTTDVKSHFDLWVNSMEEESVTFYCKMVLYRGHEATTVTSKQGNVTLAPGESGYYSLTRTDIDLIPGSYHLEAKVIYFPNGVETVLDVQSSHFDVEEY